MLKSFHTILAASLTLMPCCPGREFPAHPRLLVTEADWKALPARMEKQPEVREIIRATLDRADRVLTAPPLTHELTGRRMLSVSREALQRVLDLATAWKVTGSRKYLDACRKELLTVSGFGDWNPAHHLDTAEMQAAVAIGYDWLHGELNPPDSKVIETALLEKGLRETFRYKSLQTRKNNWNQVCMGGMILSSIALMDVEPDLCAMALAEARAALPAGLKGSYPPDGAYSEGGGYWQYGTEYAALAIGAMRTAGIPTAEFVLHPGFLESGRYLAMVHGSSGKLFNYGDTTERPIGTSLAGAWIARENRSSTLLGFFAPPFRKINPAGASRLLPLAAFWLPSPDEVEEDELPLHFVGSGHSPVAIHRTGFGKNDLFLGIKAGKAEVPHGHMDAGSFVIDWAGERWATDLGSQEYHALEKTGIALFDMEQDSQRWDVFRLNNHSHNTLTYNGGPHRVDGGAEILSSVGGENCATSLDMTAPLGLPEKAQAIRRFAVDADATSVTIVDDIAGLEDGDTITWHMMTRANVTFVKGGIELSLGKRKLSLELSSPQAGSPEPVPADPPPALHDAPNPGITRISLKATAGKDGKVNLRAVFQGRD